MIWMPMAYTWITASILLAAACSSGPAPANAPTKPTKETRAEPAAVLPTTETGEVETTGDLDKEVIRHHVASATEQYKRCYEKELLANPDVQGVVTVSFVIGADGSVSTADASGLGAPMDECIADVFRGLVFPKPTGGGVVNVRYPLHFNSGEPGSGAANVSE